MSAATHLKFAKDQRGAPFDPWQTLSVLQPTLVITFLFFLGRPVFKNYISLSSHVTIYDYLQCLQYALSSQRVETFNVDCNVSNLMKLKNAKTCRN